MAPPQGIVPGKRTRVVVVASQKGGVGKTTTTANLAASLASAGFVVGTIDLELQGQLGVSFGAFAQKPKDVGSAVVDFLDVIEDISAFGKVGTEIALDDPRLDITPRLIERMIDRTALLKGFEGSGSLWVLGSVMSLTERAKGEIAKRGWEAMATLRQLILREVGGYFDFILIDTPPSNDALASLGLAAADYVVAVCNPKIATADGARVVRNSVMRIPKRTDGLCNPVFLGTILNEAQPKSRRTPETDAVDEYLVKHDLQPFSAIINASPQISASYGISRPIVIDEPGYAASKWYETLTQELLNRISEADRAQAASELEAAG
ncbi:ParA family protein [Kitasatospora sp. NPDC088783]|uniref:ParA family protein n=1 Tax=Kitasatospora sp. NPDC088783 TaxID=3364077 RepID=UPI00380172A4